MAMTDHKIGTREELPTVRGAAQCREGVNAA